MGSVLIASLLSFSVSFFMIPVIIRMAVLRSLLDLPGHRKIHKQPTPSMGGIAVFSALLITLLLVVDFAGYPEIAGFLAAMTIIFFVGLKDDLFFITPSMKFAGQVLAVVLLLSIAPYRLDSFGGFMGVGDLHPTVSFVFTALTILVIVNAFNLIDGVDGLAALMGSSTLCFLGIAMLFKGDVAHTIVAFSAFSAILAFLIFNWNPARIFLGDTGSLVLGLINAVLVVRFISLYSAEDATSVISAAPAIGFALFFVPMADLLRLVIIRLQQGKSPFEPDMQHLHHYLLEKGFNHRQTSMLLVGSNGFFMTYALLMQHLGNTVLIFSMFVIAGLLYLGFNKLGTKTKSSVAEITDNQIPVETITRIINKESLEEINLLQ